MLGSADAGFGVLLGLWLLQSSAYFIPAATWSPVSRLGLTRALAEEQRLSVGEFAELTGDRALRDGRWYSDKAPVPSVLAVPAYGVVRALQASAGRPPEAHATHVVDGEPMRLEVNRSFSRLLYASSVATSGLAGAVIGVLLFQLLRRRFDPRPALVATVLTVLVTPIFPYTTSFFGHVPAGAFLLAAAWLFESAAGSPRRLGAGAACLALAVGCEYLAALPAVVLAGSVLWQRHPPRQLAALAVGAAVPTSFLFGYHASCFGAPWRTAYAFVQNPVFKAGHAHGFMGIGWPAPDALYGLTLGPERGLLWLAPVSAVGLCGLAALLWRSRDRTATALTLGLALLFLVNAGYYMWWGGAATGPRHLVPALPVLAFGIAHAWQLPALRPAIAVVGLLSVANMLAFTAVGVEAPEAGDALIGYAWANLGAGRLAQLPGASNLAIELGLAVGASLGPLLAWWLLGGRALWVRLQAREAA